MSKLTFKKSKRTFNECEHNLFNLNKIVKFKKLRIVINVRIVITKASEIMHNLKRSKRKIVTIDKNMKTKKIKENLLKITL